MTKRRKIRAPDIDLEALRALKGDPYRLQLLQLEKRFEQFEELRQAKKLPTTFIAFEALAALNGALSQGFDQRELQSTWPKDWGTRTVEVPEALIIVLAMAWQDYRGEYKTKSMAQAFGLEGKGTNTRKRLRKMEDEDRDRGWANEVALEYLLAKFEAEPPNLEMIIHKVADRHSDGTTDKSVSIRRAYDRFKGAIYANLRALGVLRGAGVR